jgi:galactonate dehydratase
MVMQEQTTPSELIGSRLRDRIKVYANINRATQDRTPAGFVKTALRARDQGFSAFKAAPFDGLTPSSCASLKGKNKIHHGIEIISALREALGSEALLMVDCHWRFDESGAMYALKELQAAKLHWYECPIAETHTLARHQKNPGCSQCAGCAARRRKWCSVLTSQPLRAGLNLAQPLGSSRDRL